MFSHRALMLLPHLILSTCLPGIAPECMAWQLSPDASSEIFGEDVLSDNVMALRQRARSLNANQRFEFLARWILPGETHHDFRLSGVFTQTKPAITVDGSIETGGAVGAELVSPVFDLLETAAQTGRLDELRNRILALPAPVFRPSTVSVRHRSTRWSQHQARSRAALLILIGLEQNRQADIAGIFERFYQATLKTVPQDMHDQWPETLVAWRSAKKHHNFKGGKELVELLWSQRVNRGVLPSETAWRIHMASLSWLLQYGENHSDIIHGSAAPQVKTSQLPDRWITISRMRAHTRGRGLPAVAWQKSGHELRHISGHDEDYLLYQLPVRGDFTVDADLLVSGEPQLLVAGALFGPRGSTGLITGKFNSGVSTEPLTPPLQRLKKWIHYRSVVSDSNCWTYLNGQVVNERQLPENVDPWIGIRSGCMKLGAVRDVRISGSPTIPESVVISAPSCRSGWSAYHERSLAGEADRWRFTSEPAEESVIIGRSGKSPAGSMEESLLRYFRPLIEDGAIEYEFYYEPGKVLGHPAFDRLAFLIEPDGVRAHSITDGRYEKSTVLVGKPLSLVLKDDRKQSRPVPLKAGQWNKVRLTAVGQRLTIHVNDESVFAHNLNRFNSRHFGLFHFRDLTELRVRNVVMRGEWPRGLPAVADQLLAEKEMLRFDDRLNDLEPVFVHDFRNGLPNEYFVFNRGPGLNTHQITPFGFVHTQRSDGKFRQSGLKTSFQLKHDFDITADFGDLTLAEKKFGGCEVSVTCEGGYSIVVQRCLHTPNVQLVVVYWKSPAPEGSGSAAAGRSNQTSGNLWTQATAGRIRVVRAGDTVTVLFAEQDSTVFRVVSKNTFPGLGGRTAEVRLSTFATNSNSAAVTWKRLRLAAEKILVIPDPRSRPKNRLFVVHSDGSGLKQVTNDIPSAPDAGHGSPDWSATGEFIAFDAWTGRPSTTHAFRIRPDGSDMKDLGVAAIPSFAPDGRRLTFTWSSIGLGTMKTDGTDRKSISRDGWSAAWSPDGKSVVFEIPRNINGQTYWNLGVIDLESGQRRDLLDGEHRTRYARIYYHMEWSPDGQQVVFKGDLKSGGSEVGVVSIDGSTKGFRVLTKEQTGTDFSWHPNGNQILTIKRSLKHAGNRLYIYDLATGKLNPFAGLPQEYTINGADWSHDGLQIVVSGWKPKTPARWIPRTATGQIN